jgi:hypothetical protein
METNGGRGVRGPIKKATATRSAVLTLLALASAAAGSMPAIAAATPRTIAPSGEIQGRAVHSGEGSPGPARAALPLRVANPATYAREKQRAEQRAGSGSPLSAAAPGPAATAAPVAAVFGSLNGAGLSASEQIAAFGHDGTPPDTTGAIGPEDYVEFVNSEVAAYKRSNLALVGSPVELAKFIGAVAPCDPQIKYDPKSSRWFYSAIRCDRTRTSNTLYAGFSKTSDPADFSTATGHGWCGYAYSTGSTIEDYDKLGLDSSHIVVGSNSFNAQTEAFITAHILSLPKPASGKIETCPAAPKLTTFGSKSAPLRTSVESHLAFTPQPATVADESTSGFVASADESTAGSGNGSHVMIWQLAGTGEKPELKALGAPKVAEFRLPPNVPQPGSSDGIDSLDGRLTQAVAAADPAAGGIETVWTQHTVAGGAGSVVRWYELLPGKVEVRQEGTISDPSLFVFNGAIAPTLSGGAVIDYNTAGGSALVKIMAQSRSSSNATGTMNGPITLASSAAIDSDFSCPSVEPRAPSCRWGDYAGASVDPTNANLVWGSNQINGSAGTEHQAQWATQNFALTPAVAPTVETNPASALEQTSATLHATVNPNGSEVNDCHFDYGTTEAYGSSAPCTPAPGSGGSPVAVSAALTGLTANVTYHFRVSATNAGGTATGADRTFKTLPNPPTVLTTGASAITQTSATLNAQVNPNGAEVSECRFEWGATSAYGQSAPCAQPVGSGTSAEPVSAALESLAEGTTYHFRISATNATGTSVGSDAEFTTALVLGPHWYQNHVRLAETSLEEGPPAMAWGRLTLENMKVGAFTCQTLIGARLANPAGGGAGKGSFDGVTLYDCVAPTCEAARGLLQATAEKLKWSSVLIEEAGLFRDRIEGIALREVCVGGESNVEFHGTLTPKLEAGSSIGAAPAKLEFGTGSGALQSIEGAGPVAARLKFMGFEGGEIISAA